MKVIQAKVCLLGDFAVGKTSLVRRYVEGRFDDRYLSTIGVKVSRKVITIGDLELRLLLWDLAGGEKFANYEENYLRGASGALIVCDLTRRNTLDIFPSYARQIQALNPGAVLVFLGNKADLEQAREVQEVELQAISSSLGGPFLITSAKTGEQVEAAFQTLADLIEAKHGLTPS